LAANLPQSMGNSESLEGTLFLRLGGAYPIALFVNRVVDSLLRDKRVGRLVDREIRSEAMLKYMLTEVVCGATGGFSLGSAICMPLQPLLSKRQMTCLLNMAKEESDHFGSGFLRKDLILSLYNARHMFTGAKSQGKSLARPQCPSCVTARATETVNGVLSRAAESFTSSLNKVSPASGNMDDLQKVGIDKRMECAISDAHEPATRAGMCLDTLQNRAKQTFQHAILQERMKAIKDVDVQQASRPYALQRASFSEVL